MAPRVSYRPTANHNGPATALPANPYAHHPAHFRQAHHASNKLPNVNTGSESSKSTRIHSRVPRNANDSSWNAITHSMNAITHKDRFPYARASAKRDAAPAQKLPIRMGITFANHTTFNTVQQSGLTIRPPSG